MPVMIDPESIRPARDILNVLKLGERTDAGAERVREVARSTAPDAEERRLGDSASGLYVGDRLVAYADPNDGESRNFPQLDLLTPAGGLDDRARRAAGDLAEDERFIPRDATGHTILDPAVLSGSRGSRRRLGDVEQYLGFARIQRTVRDLAVVGKGSRATATVSGDGIEAVTHNWRAADVVEERPGDDIDRDRIARSIVESLEPIADEHDVRVDAVDLVYYDGDNDLIQPVYRFTASYRDLEGRREGDAAAGHLVGYVPVWEELDRLPLTIERPRIRPRQPRAAVRPVRQVNKRPTIGRYVVREDNAGWVTSANSFLSGLQTAGLFSGISPINRQYYWAEPRLFLDENRQFVDAVQVALTEVHGNWGLFSTLRNDADFVRLSGIPADGYGGSAAQGALAYWILHSCAVIPTSIDATTTYDVWWNTFQGLHAALGYRTEMWINDEVTFRFAFFAGLGAPMVSNWLSTVINDDSYWPVTTYVDSSNYSPARTLPFGRPSAVNVFGHADDTIFQTTPLPRPSILQQWWYGD